jgi:triacylglycerol lipase
MFTTTSKYIFFLIGAFLVGCAAQPKSCNLNPPHLIPVLYVPGLGDDGKYFENWLALKNLFRERGYDLKIANVPAFGTTKEGAEKLLSEIDECHFKDRNIKFHIIAKSMGGLSARRMLRENSMSNRVMSLTTISTPHHGSEVADNYLNINSDCFRTNKKETCVIPKELLELTNRLGIKKDELGDAGKDLTTCEMKKFNQWVTDDPGISYFSFRYKIDCEGSLCDSNPLAFYPANPLSACWHNMIFKTRATKNLSGENDGLVSVESATWGTPIGAPYEGEHLAETSKPNEMFPIAPRYKGKEIWQDVFERVIKNLDEQKATHPQWVR